MMHRYLILFSLSFWLCALWSCENTGPDLDLGSGGDGDGDADGDADGDSDADSDTDSDSDSDADSDTDTDTEEVPIVPDCSSCTGVGNTLENMRCAIDLCDDNVFVNQSYTSPTQTPVNQTRAAVAHFGDTSNDLTPLMNDSYALMATGNALATDHSDQLGGSSQTDPFAKDLFLTYNVMEWSIRLKAPPEAHGFQIHYVFFSSEYDEWVGSAYNDKFYIFIEANSTNGGERTVINFTECRDPDQYTDFTCQADMSFCEEGNSYCYVAINTALSECCWYPQGSMHVNGGQSQNLPACPDGFWTTNISGTGYECADSFQQEGTNKGSSTGWLKTEWPIEPGEEFNVIFHIHDTSDQKYDSEVILDKFLFVKEANAGTVPIE
jgi:hypothetical protein